MHAKITRTFRIAEGENTRKYTPGDVAKDSSAVWAIKNGYGEEITLQEAGIEAKPEPEKKSKAPAKNKAAQPSENK